MTKFKVTLDQLKERSSPAPTVGSGKIVRFDNFAPAER